MGCVESSDRNVYDSAVVKDSSKNPQITQEPIKVSRQEQNKVQVKAASQPVDNSSQKQAERVVVKQPEKVNTGVKNPEEKSQVKVQEKPKIKAEEKAPQKKSQQKPISIEQKVTEKAPQKKSQQKPISIEQKVTKSLADIKKFQFSKKSQKLLSGKFSTEKGGDKDGLKIKEEDCFEGIGVVSLWYQNACYTDGNYNNNNYLIEKGEVAEREAYRVHPPNSKFKNFLASQHCLAFKLAEQKDYIVYKFEDNSLDVALEINKNKVAANSWNLTSTLKVSQLGKPITYIVVPANQKLTPFTSIAKDIEGATVYKDSKIRIQLIKFPLPVDPPVPQDFSHGPNSHYNCYSPNRSLFFIEANSKQYIVWNDRELKTAYLTQINRKQTATKSISLNCKLAGNSLTGACGNNDFFVFGQIQSGAASSKNGTRKMELVKCDYTGAEKKRQVVNTDKNNLNVYNFDAGQLQLNGDTIGLMISRKMTMSTDGLNHQGGYAAIFNATTLKSIKNFGQTSGHSFGHSIIPRQAGGFMGIDLGDNYPRAIHHWVFDQNSIEFKKVYSFKTEHGGDAKSPAGVTYPAYPEISKNGKKFFKWSNDNRTYTELAAPGVIDHDTGNIIVFAGENQPGSLDNSKVGNYNNCSRNIGFVKTSKNLKDLILSKGADETGGFFTFGGTWEVLKNQGIMWLTNLAEGENASRVKAVGLKDKVFIMFELWSKDAYINTQYMVLDVNGGVLVKNTVIPYKIRVHKSDDIYSKGSSVVIYSGGNGKILNRYEVFV